MKILFFILFLLTPWVCGDNTKLRLPYSGIRLPMELPTRYLSGTGLKKTGGCFTRNAGQFRNRRRRLLLWESDRYSLFRRPWSKLGLPGHSRPGYRTGTQHILGTGCRVSQGKYHMFVSYIQGYAIIGAGMPVSPTTLVKIYGTGNMQENHRSTPISSILPYTGLPTVLGKCGTKTRTAACDNDGRK